MSDCNRFPRLLQLRDAGDLDAVQAHLAECSACADAWDDLEALTALGQSLPDGRPDEARRESVRTRILAQAQLESGRSPARRPIRLVALAAAAAIGAWIIGTQFVAEPPAPIGRIASAPGAVFSVRKTEAVEWVALDEGRITIRVPTLPDDRRLVVVTDDAEVEVRGTIFTVEAIDGRLTAVEVEEGVVEVRPAGAEAVRLKPSQRWATERAAARPAAPEPPSSAIAAADVPRELPGEPTQPPSEPREWPRADARAPEAAPRVPAKPPQGPPAGRSDAAPVPKAADPEPAPAGRPVAPAGTRAAPVAAPDDPPAPDAGPIDAPAKADASATPDPGVSPQTARFDEGWQALRAGRPSAAAAAFAAAAALDGPLIADARWWRAVALGRGGDDGAAREAVLDFLRLHPRSPRKAEASVMLGWLDFAAGRVDAAEAAFTAGLSGARPAVRESAREGLDAVKNWRAARE